MISIVLLNLLRSKYGVASESVLPGTVASALDQLIARHPEMRRKDFEDAVLFVNGVRIDRVNRLEAVLRDGDEVVFTHFVGGG